ncbi:MAG: hypothetical protein IPM01_05125 [Burkholderiaceae bacterium]|nr:hypothetical protein [Burkholderiaceae bacterium]
MIDEGVFRAEDLFISAQIRLGAAGGANDTFVLGRFEQHLRRFHGHVRAMLDACAPAGRTLRPPSRTGHAPG